MKSESINASRLGLALVLGLCLADGAYAGAIPCLSNDEICSSGRGFWGFIGALPAIAVLGWMLWTWIKSLNK